MLSSNYNYSTRCSDDNYYFGHPSPFNISPSQLRNKAIHQQHTDLFLVHPDWLIDYYWSPHPLIINSVHLFVSLRCCCNRSLLLFICKSIHQHNHNQIRYNCASAGALNERIEWLVAVVVLESFNWRDGQPTTRNEPRICLIGYNSEQYFICDPEVHFARRIINRNGGGQNPSLFFSLSLPFTQSQLSQPWKHRLLCSVTRLHSVHVST